MQSNFLLFDSIGLSESVSGAALRAYRLSGSNRSENPFRHIFLSRRIARKLATTKSNPRFQRAKLTGPSYTGAHLCWLDLYRPNEHFLIHRAPGLQRSSRMRTLLNELIPDTPQAKTHHSLRERYRTLTLNYIPLYFPNQSEIATNQNDPVEFRSSASKTLDS